MILEIEEWAAIDALIVLVQVCAFNARHALWGQAIASLAWRLANGTILAWVRHWDRWTLLVAFLFLLKEENV